MAFLSLLRNPKKLRTTLGLPLKRKDRKLRQNMTSFKKSFRIKSKAWSKSSGPNANLIAAYYAIIRSRSQKKLRRKRNKRPKK